MTILTIKRGDMLPALSAILVDAGGVEADLDTAIEVRFLMRHQRGEPLKVNAVATGAGAMATYAWEDGDTDTVGLYLAEFRVTWPESKPQTFPQLGSILVRIIPDLGPVPDPGP